MAKSDGKAMNSNRAIIAMLFTMVVWGIGPVFIRSLSTELGPADALVIRYVIVSSIYGVGLYIVGMRPMPREHWPRLLAASIAGMLFYNLGSVFGFELVPAGIGGLIIGTQPLLIAVLAALLTREELTPAAMAGLVVAFIGTALLFWNDLGGGTGGNELLGGLFIFLSGIAWAYYVILAKPLIQSYGAYQTTALTIMIATVPMMTLASADTVVTLFEMTPRQWFEMLFMALLASVVAAVTWNYGAGRLPSVTSGTFLYLVPVIAVAAGALILGETITTTMIVGGVLILLGVALAQFGEAWIGRLFGSPPPAMLKAYAALGFAVVAWGCVPVAIRYLVTDLTAGNVLLLRLVPTGLLALGLLLARGRKPIAPSDWSRILIAALLGNVGYQVLAHFGLATVPASWTGMIFGLEPLFIALFAVLLANERLSVELMLGMVVAFAGTAVIAARTLGGATEVPALGLALVIASTMGWGIYTVVLRPMTQKYGAPYVSCLSLAISAVPMFIFIRPDLGDTVSGMTLGQWSAMGFLIVVGTFAAVIFWNYGIAIVGSARGALLLYVQPVVAAAGGMLFLGEELTWTLLLGGLLIMAGVAVAQVQLPFFSARSREIERQDRRAAVERLVASARTARLPK